MTTIPFLLLLILKCTFQISAKQNLPLVDFVPQFKGAKITVSLAGKHSPTVGSFRSSLEPTFWTLADLHAPAANKDHTTISPAEQAPPDVPVFQDAKSVGPEKAQSYPGIYAQSDGAQLPSTSLCLGRGVVLQTVGPGILVLEADTGLAASQPFDISSASKSSLVSTQCIYDPATRTFFIAANTGKRIHIYVSEDPTSGFVGPFSVQSNGLNSNAPGKALPGLSGCLTDANGSCEASNMEVSVDTYGVWLTVQLFDPSTSPMGSLLIGIPKDSLTPNSRSIPPFVSYSSWVAPAGSMSSALRLSRVQADGSHARAESGTIFVLSSYFANSSILVWAVTNTARLRHLAQGDDTLLPTVSEVQCVSLFPLLPPSSIAGLLVQEPGGVVTPDVGGPDLSSVTFDHSTGYLWTAASTAITINGGMAMSGATYFVLKPDIVAGKFSVGLMTQGYTTYSRGSLGAAFLSPVITVSTSQSAMLFGMVCGPETPLSPAYVPVSLDLGPGAVVYFVNTTMQSSAGRGSPIAAHAAVSGDGTFWMSSGVLRMQDTGCPGTTSCTSLQTTITRFQNKAGTSPEGVTTASAEAATISPAGVPLPVAPPSPADAASGAAAMPPSAPMEAAPLSEVAAAAHIAEAAAFATIPSTQTPQLSPTTTAAPALVASAAAPLEVSAAAKQLEADTPILFGVPLSKLRTFIQPSLELSPSPAGPTLPSAADLTPVASMQTPSPPFGLFQLPELPTFGQQARPEAQRPAEAAPSETPKPEKLLGFDFPRLPPFGQLPGSSAPWGFKLPFLSFRAAAPMPADGLTDFIGPAEAPELAYGAHVLDPASTAPSAVPRPMALAERFTAPKLQKSASSLPSAQQEASSIAIQSQAEAPTVRNADVGRGWTRYSNALDQAPSMLPAAQPKAAKAAYSSGSAPVLPQQAGEHSGYPVDTETVRGAVEALFMSQQRAALPP